MNSEAVKLAESVLKSQVKNKMEEVFNIEKKSFKEIKENIDKIDIIEEYKKGSLEKIIEILKNDKRKNVNSLGTSIEKKIKAYKDEIIRVRKMYDFDKSFGNFTYIAGVDEVGRGPLAGPIVSCSVILDLNVKDEELILYLNDSKKVNKKKREELAEIIKEKAVAYSIKECSNKEIDEIGIGVANNKIFLEATNKLPLNKKSDRNENDIKEIIPDLVLSDGYLIKGTKLENKAVIKGDTKSASIAAASIVAKVYRDNLMKEYAKKYPEYDFEDNAGYGTKKHLEALKTIGKCEIHRETFLKNIL